MKVFLNTHKALVCAGFLLILLTGTTGPTETIKIGAFSENPSNSPFVDGWQSMKLGNRTQTDYRVVEHQGMRAIQAMSEKSASGLLKRVDINPEDYPILTWQWQIDKVISEGSLTKKKGDDFAARVFVMFDYSMKALPLGQRIKHRTLKLFGYRDVPVRALNYVWAGEASTNTIVPSPFSNQVQMVVTRSDQAPLDQWLSEQRNIVEDYQKAFGEAPGAITGIAIMTDTDNTGASATAYFGDIALTQKHME